MEGWSGHAVPETNVTPSMKKALEKKGVKFVKTEAEAVEWNKNAAAKEREPEVRFSKGKKKALVSAVPGVDSPFKATVVTSASDANI